MKKQHKDKEKCKHEWTRCGVFWDSYIGCIYCGKPKPKKTSAKG